MHIVIVGAGIIGLASGWRLIQRGTKVTFIDRNAPGSGASWAAAGMLAPAYEAALGDGIHPDLFDLCAQSAAAWPDFAGELERAAGIDVGFCNGPTLALAKRKEDLPQLESLVAALARRGVEHTRIPLTDLNVMEPAITGPVHGAVKLPSDGWVDNRRVCEALVKALRHAGATFLVGDTIGSDLLAECDGVLETTGSDSTSAGIIPVKGIALSLAPMAALPEHVVRFGSHYIVPHRDRVIVGASVEWGRGDVEPDQQIVDGLLQGARQVCGAIADVRPVEVWAGVRPGTKDHAPLLGKVGHKTWRATGHYRNGILLGPITAEIMTSQILGDDACELGLKFDPCRFETAAGSV